MQPPTGDPLEPLNGLVGSWTIEATHPSFHSTLVGGRADFEWLEGKQFLLQRSTGSTGADAATIEGR
jgi:hypothetical protein